jgi:hypothetical protein
MDKVIEVLKLLNKCGEGLNYLSPAGRMNHIKAIQALTQAQSAQKVIDAVGELIKSGSPYLGNIKRAYAEYVKQSVNDVKQSDNKLEGE